MQKRRYKGVLFDLDGTLVDTAGDIRGALNAALEAEGARTVDRQGTMRVVGRGLRNAIVRALAEQGRKVSPKRLEELYRVLMTYYAAHPTDFSVPYPGIPDLLRELDVPFGVLSNKADELVQTIVRTLFPGIRIPFVLGLRDDLPRKPDPSSFRLFLKKFSLSSSDVLYVGDSEVDIALCRNAGCDCALCPWGFRGKEKLLEIDPGETCEDIADLRKRIFSPA